MGASRKSHGPDGRARRILVVDDDEPTRTMLVRALTAHGYIVDQAATGGEAVEAFGRTCPDVLLSDLVMPGPNGQELASLCRARCPDALLVFMSGYTEEELHRLEITQVVFLPKPISPNALVQTLDRLVAERDQAQD